VASVTAKIDQLNSQPLAPDSEVEAWKRKIAALSAVNPTASYSSPLSQSNVFSPTNPKGSAIDAIRQRKQHGSSGYGRR
jgi:hypothetical protein